jgi:hypothetical protein
MTPTDIDVRAVAEVLVDVLVERGLVVAAPTGCGRVLDAAAVAAFLGRERQWVYDNAEELGAFRFGDGPRARLGFDLHSVERWKRQRPARRGRATPGPPRAAVRGGGTALIP